MSVRLRHVPAWVAALVLLSPIAAFGDEQAVPHDEAGTDHHDDHDDGHHDDHAGEDVIIVQATRTGRRVQDEPIRVEIVVREEIEEKAIMRPGNIAMLVAEMGGVRTQVTSPALGAANIRMQGLYGRYTQLLSDGLPLYGGQAASIGLLQIPPTDLAQVEVIKGSASSLYGASALGGVINLVSRRPGDVIEGEWLFNATTRDGQDLTLYADGPLARNTGISLTAGAHRQSEQDLDGDGWIDMPGYDRWTARPRLFWDGDSGASAYVTVGMMTEQRRGGTLPGRTVPDGSPFPQDQDTRRFDAGLIGEMPLNAVLSAHVRASAMVQDHEHRFGTIVEDDRHETTFLEISLSGDLAGTDWVAGLAWQSDVFESDTFPVFDYTYEVPGVFAQVERDLSEDISVSASGRLDMHSEFGTQFSPRLSVLYRPGDFTIRGSWGRGFFAPTPFVEEIEAAGLSRLEPLTGLEEETAETASIDIGYRRGPIEASATVFASNLVNVTRLDPFASVPGGADDRVRLVNVDGTTRIRGSELLLRYSWGDYKVTGSYLYLDATEPVTGLAQTREIPLTPQHSAGLVAMWEQHGRGRVGFEAYYTGAQNLEDNPYRSRSDAYLHLGFLGEITFGRVSVFVNAENLLDNRQTDTDPLVRPVRAPTGSWTTDVWTTTDGFVVNGGVRLRFGG